MGWYEIIIILGHRIDYISNKQVNSDFQNFLFTFELFACWFVFDFLSNYRISCPWSGIVPSPRACEKYRFWRKRDFHAQSMEIPNILLWFLSISKVLMGSSEEDVDSEHF